MGSVKDLRIIERATEQQSGIGRFQFSDRYSVFDWGEMPDLITNKGKALCIIGAYFFEKLNDLGILTHYRGLVEDGKVKMLSELSAPVDTMEVYLLRVLKPVSSAKGYDYSNYTHTLSNILIPLEIIYRNALPAGSSVFRRLENGSLTLEQLGLTKMPSTNDVLQEPILDVSTKLEVTDRYMSWEEAQSISALSDQELETLKRTTAELNQMISAHVAGAGLINEDGKVEYGFDKKRRLMLVDILGTPDECRFTYNGIPVSKEVARIHYRKTDWYVGIEKAKKQDRANWKSLVKSPPPPLPRRLFELIIQLYQSTCNEITQREWFQSPPLAGILKEMQEQLEE
jgi:phosphoribosylaminoimidazole-succinocarboxamide synthase